MRLIGYSRVSTEEQAKKSSIEQQKAQLEAYCAAYGHELVDVYVDVGSGAAVTGRPQYYRALDALARVDGLIACKLDRIARNTRDVLMLVEDCIQPDGKALILLDLSVDTTHPMGKAMLTVMAAVAALERDMIRERTMAGKLAKAAAGGYAFGRPPYGFKSVDGRLVEVPAEQEVISLIRSLGAKGLSDWYIMKELNNRGILNRKGTKWFNAQVGNIMKRPDGWNGLTPLLHRMKKSKRSPWAV